jgi:hypothetical protein
MNSGSVLNAALINVRRALKERGFVAKRNSFHRRTEAGNTLLLSIQKSVSSSATDTQVALNYGVYSARIGSRLQDEPKAALDVSRAHWSKRFTEGGREKWLHVKATDSADETARVLLDAVEGLLPDWLEHATDEALRDEWLSGSSPGLVKMSRLLFAAILVNAIGPAERLNDVVGELRKLVADGIHQGRVERLLETAGVRVA